MFWTDAAQASERLTGCVVNYDGKPVYIEEVNLGEDQRTVECKALLLEKGTRKRIVLSDQKWNNFRDLPRLGWFNYVSITVGTITPVFLERRAVNSRSHGLTSANTNCYNLTPRGVEREKYANFVDYMKNPGYHETSVDETAYPKLSTILMALGEEPSGVAFSPKFCVIVTEEGMKWLFRKRNRIGFFTGTDSLNLFPKNGFYKEELQSCPSFDINNIREF